MYYTCLYCPYDFWDYLKDSPLEKVGTLVPYEFEDNTDLKNDAKARRRALKELFAKEGAGVKTNEEKVVRIK